MARSFRMRWVKFFAINLIAGAVCHFFGIEETFQTGYVLGAVFVGSINICFG